MEYRNYHINIIEDKANDSAMTAKKKEAWKQVRMAMLAAGFDRYVPKLRQQWARLKWTVKKFFRAERKATTAPCMFSYFWMVLYHPKSQT